MVPHTNFLQTNQTEPVDFHLPSSMGDTAVGTLNVRLSQPGPTLEHLCGKQGPSLPLQQREAQSVESARDLGSPQYHQKSIRSGRPVRLLSRSLGTSNTDIPTPQRHMKTTLAPLYPMKITTRLKSCPSRLSSCWNESAFRMRRIGLAARSS